MKPATENTPGSLPPVVEPSQAAPLTIRPARPEDVEVLVNLVRELAVYEKLEQYARATPDDFRQHLFGPRPAAEAALAELGSEPVGYALWFTTFSSFRGQPGLYLEDLFVKPDFRGRRIGKTLLAYVARLAVERGYTRLVWSVLNWNEPAIGFYRALGARPVEEWTDYRIDEEPLLKLAASAPIPQRS
jgi:ribosomal protein S18 acetylase RimI-like enzyme